MGTMTRLTINSPRWAAVPVMICYWLPEDGLESNLNVFFDETADKNLDVSSVFSLGVGLAQMFGKIALRHGFPEAASSK